MESPARIPANPWRWVPSLYFAEGIPYVAVMTLSVVMYKNLQVSNTAIALYTSWLYLPWVIKPLWSPLVDLCRTKRWWIIVLQFVLGAALALVALTVPAPYYFRATLAVFWLLAFSSATHDIAADGFYLLALPPGEQAALVGVRSTCYRLAMLAGQGGLVYLAGSLQAATGDVPKAWMEVFALLAVFFVLISVYHLFVLPRPATDGLTRFRPVNSNAEPFPRYLVVLGNAFLHLHLIRLVLRPFELLMPGYLTVFGDFFRKKDIGRILAFLLLYRFAEAQLLKLVTPFLLDARAVGGLGLTNQQVGVIYGTIGPITLTLGGLAGGYVIARHGLKRLLWPMIIAMHLPNLVFIGLALLQPANLPMIGGAIAIEQFGYGFGFAAYLVYMMMIAEGPHKTAHYAVCTGFMALGMMVPGMPAGWIQEKLGYPGFFLWVCVAAIPAFAATALIRVDPAFGRKA